MKKRMINDNGHTAQICIIHRTGNREYMCCFTVSFPPVAQCSFLWILDNNANVVLCIFDTAICLQRKTIILSDKSLSQMSCNTYIPTFSGDQEECSSLQFSLTVQR